MAYSTISKQWANRNNIKTLWDQIVENFVHAAPASVGDIPFWETASTVNTPVQPTTLSVPQDTSLHQYSYLGITSGKPTWVQFSNPSAAFTEVTDSSIKKLQLTITTQGKSGTVFVPFADATHLGILSAVAQEIGGDKTFKDNIYGEKNIQADWGVAAEGIADLGLSAGGGGGTVTELVLCGRTYSPDSGIITIPKTQLQADLELGDAAYRDIGTVASGETRLVTGDSVNSAINAAITAAMKVEGVTTTPISNGSTTNPVTINGQSVDAYKGMVVFYNSKEFVWAGTSWVELGDESSFALKTITISTGSTGYLTGGGDLSLNRTIDISTTAKGYIDTAYAHATDANRLTTAQDTGFYKFATTQHGHIKSVTAVGRGDLTGLLSTSTDVVTNLNADLLDGYQAAGLFESMVNDNDQLKIQIGNTSKTLKLDYAKTTSRFKSDSSFTNQEFIFRNSPKTIDTDSVKLDRIKGKTVVWNQKVINGDFKDGITGWSNSGGSCSVSNEEVTFNVTSNYNNLYQYIRNTNTSHHFYYSAYVKSSSFTQYDVYLYHTNGTTQVNKTFDISSNYSRCHYIFSPDFGTDILWFQALRKNSGTGTLVAKNIMLIDLTLFFNGNEAQALGVSNFNTQSNIDTAIANFERLYFNAYYDYNAGQLINNSAKGLETVEFNLWDEVWKIGDINAGAEVSGSRVISANFTSIKPSTQYYASADIYYLCYYDSNKNYISADSINGTGKVVTSPSNAAYFKFNTISTYGSVYKGDIIVNLSDSTRNGQYEPYKRNVLDLHLDNIQVKSHNIWDEEWEVGNLDEQGLPISNPNVIRAKNFIPVSSGMTYYFHKGTAEIFTIQEYDVNQAHIKYTTYSAGDRLFTLSSTTRFIKLCVGGTTYNNDICINESSSFNGQYEPHGILTINGLKQAGSVYDEIVGSKLVKRLGTQLFDANTSLDTIDINATSAGCVFVLSVPCKQAGQDISNQYGLDTTAASGAAQTDKTIRLTAGSGICIKDTSKFSGTMTKGQVRTALIGLEYNYELATPIEYELATPIPTAMPAGTTERRLPEDTSDSVLAPFACDMTYGAQMADVLTIVPYADKVTRLATKRNLWGNWFDGTQDLTGDIYSEGNIQAELGMAAMGICDLGLSAGGGGGTVTSIQVGTDGPEYYPTSGKITLNSYLTELTFASNILRYKHDGDDTFTSLISFGTVYSHDHDEYLTALGVSGDTLTWSKGGTAQDAITVPYATTALDAKTELKQDQTITYRQTGGGTLTKPYSSGVIKRVLGNSVVWNQTVKQEVELGQTKNKWKSFDSGTTLTANDDELQILKSSGYGIACYELDGAIISGHTYYLSSDIKTTAAANSIYIGAYGVDTVVDLGRTQIASNNWQNIATIKRCATASSQQFRITDGRSSNFDIVYAKNFRFIDLTLFFNGNVPSDITVDSFERDYGYLLANPEYNAGTLINNACSGLESVGFNLWDEEYDRGFYQDDGTFVNNSDYLSSKNFIDITSGSEYYSMSTSGGNNVYFIEYDANGTFLRRRTLSKTTKYTPNTDAKKFKFSIFYQSAYNNDTCINIWDASKNGQYEPYRKNTLPLHLNSFRVKDAQGNIVTITGLNSCYSPMSSSVVRDEIVGNKYIKRLEYIKVTQDAELTFRVDWTSSGAIAIERSGANNGRGNGGAQSSKYIGTIAGTIGEQSDKTIRIPHTGSLLNWLCIKDSSFTSVVTAEQARTALLGLEIVYELDTPIEYEIIDDFSTTYPIDVLGTESIPEGEMVAPFIGDIQYGAKQNDFAWDIDNLACALNDMNISHYSSLSDSTKDVHVITINGKKFYLKFRATQADATTTPQTLPAFELAVADNANGDNEQVFSFGTITEDWITTNCVLPS